MEIPPFRAVFYFAFGWAVGFGWVWLFFPFFFLDLNPVSMEKRFTSRKNRDIINPYECFYKFFIKRS